MADFPTGSRIIWPDSLTTAFGFGYNGDVEFFYGPPNLPAATLYLAPGEVLTVEVPTYISAPPASDGPGDWPRRFVLNRLSPTASEDQRQRYVCPLDARAYVRYWEVANRTSETREARVEIAGYVVHDGPVPPNATITSASGLLIPLGPGEEVWATTPVDLPGVWCAITGIETVLAATSP